MTIEVAKNNTKVEDLSEEGRRLELAPEPSAVVHPTNESGPVSGSLPSVQSLVASTSAEKALEDSSVDTDSRDEPRPYAEALEAVSKHYPVIVLRDKSGRELIIAGENHIQDAAPAKCHDQLRSHFTHRALEGYRANGLFDRFVIKPLVYPYFKALQAVGTSSISRSRKEAKENPDIENHELEIGHKSSFSERVKLLGLGVWSSSLASGMAVMGQQLFESVSGISFGSTMIGEYLFTASTIGFFAGPMIMGFGDSLVDHAKQKGGIIYNRNETMAKNLKELLARVTDEPILAIVGASHVYHLAELMLEDGEFEEVVSDDK